MDVATINPRIPCSILAAEDIAFLKRFGFEAEQTKENGEDKTYFYAPEYHSSDFDESGNEADEIDLAHRLKSIVKRSDGALAFLYVDIAYAGSKYEYDSIGGGAIFATARSCKLMSTAGWIEKQIERLNRNNKPARKKGRK